MKTKLTNPKNSVPLRELSALVLRKMRITILSLVFSVLACGGSFAQIQIGQDIDGEAAYNNSGIVSMPDAYTVAIGAPGNDGNGIDAGHVRIYSWNGNSWVQKGNDINGETAYDKSGWSVNMPNANTVAIGAPANGSNDMGHVRIYYWNGSQWTQKGNDLNGEATNDNSGYSISMPDANTVAIGALFNNDNGNEAGQVRIYSWNGSIWLQKGIDINGEAAFDRSGCSVSMPDANTVAVGSYFNDGNGNGAGHIRIFRWNGSTWIQKGIDIDGESLGDQSGSSISMPDSNTVAIGAPYNDENGYCAGHVRIFSWSGSEWVQKGNDIDGEAAEDLSGHSVSMADANTVAIGAMWNDGNGDKAGQVRIYSWNGNLWLQKGLDIDGESDIDVSGYSVSMPNSNTVAIGAGNNSGNGAQSGHVRIYKLKVVYGIIYNDINENCTQESEPGIANCKAIVNPGNNIVETNSNGQWYIDTLPIGNYTITYNVPANWISYCSTTQSFTVTDVEDITYAPDFGLVSTQQCASPDVSVNMPFMRPCFSNQKVYVNACNQYIATGALNSAYTDIELDSLIIPQSASLAYTSLGNNTYRFQLGNLNPGQCVNFTIDCNVSCDAMLGQTLCLEANLFPADSCVFDTVPEPYPGDFTPCTLPWDKSSISVKGWCQNDSIYFSVCNSGDDMDCFSPVRIYIDGVYTTLDSLQLTAGTCFFYSFAGDGRTWRLEADQHPLHPGNSHPNATVEACGNLANWTPDLVNILPPNDADPIVDIYCGVVTGSYDPNDKTGYPTGLAYNHYIMPNQQLQYVIRFQNTGTDTAFTVVVRDTLDMDLDIFSVIPGVASNTYNFQMYGPRVLEWTFYNIQLPDSNHNEAESHGFCTFTVNQNHDLANNTKITNSADIYFDYNAPITTNQTLHTVNDQVQVAVVTKVVAQGNKVSEVSVYPNPATNEIYIEISNVEQQMSNVEGEKGYRVYGVDGKKVLEGKLETTKTRISTKELEGGVYFVEVSLGGEKTTSKLVITK